MTAASAAVIDPRVSAIPPPTAGVNAKAIAVMALNIFGAGIIQSIPLFSRPPLYGYRDSKSLN